MAKGKNPKLVVAIVNVLVGTNENYQSSDCIIFMKLEKKLLHKGHVFFGTSEPRNICSTGTLLKH